jgi:hypothetical protein
MPENNSTQLNLLALNKDKSINLSCTCNRMASLFHCMQVILEHQYPPFEKKESVPEVIGMVMMLDSSIQCLDAIKQEVSKKPLFE